MGGATEQKVSRTFFLVNAVVSVAALALLAWLLLFRRIAPGGEWNLRFVPALNSALNATSGLLLVAGWVAIKRKRADLHKILMSTAFGASAVFLVGYVAYHAVHGDTKFGGTGALRLGYLVILATHVVASLGILPLALSAFYFALRDERGRHVRVTRWLLPMWLYVSVTGVVVYQLLKPYYP